MPLFIDLHDSRPSPDVIYRISDEHITATDPHNSAGEEYLPLLIELGEVRIAQQYIHGGLVRPEYGGLVVSPEVFAASWPPPVTLDCWVSYVPEGSAPSTTPGGDVLVMAIAHLAEWDGRVVRYDLTSHRYPDEINNTLVVGTLAEVCAEYAADLVMPGTVPMSGAITYAGRSPAPDVYLLVEGRRTVMELMGDLAAFFTHRIVVSPTGGATMTDATQSVGTPATVHTSDVVSITYLAGHRYRKYTAAYIQPYIRNIELRIREAGTCTQIVMSEVDVAKAVGGPLSKPSVQNVVRKMSPPQSSYIGDPLSGFPVANLVDGNQSTWWATKYDYVPVVSPLIQCLQIAVGSGTIAEYALKSRTWSSGDVCAPTKWDLYGYHETLARYMFIGRVESQDWGSNEQRRYAVPADTNWPVEVVGNYGATDTWTAPLVGHQGGHAKIVTALGLIRDLNEQERVRIILPMGGGLRPQIGQVINVIDDTTPELTTSYLVCASLTYNFAAQIIVAEGPGGITR